MRNDIKENLSASALLAGGPANSLNLNLSAGSPYNLLNPSSGGLGVIPTANAVQIGNGSGALTQLTLTAGQILASNAGAPTGLTLTANGVVIGGGTSTPSTVVLSAGQVLVGTAGAPVGGSISGTFTATVTVTGTSQTMAASTLYFNNTTTGTTTYTLPASPSVGQTVGLLGLSTAAGSAPVIQATGSHQIQIGATVGSVAGTATAASKTEVLFLVYAATNLWVATPGASFWTLS